MIELYEKGHSLRQIARVASLSFERIRQILEKNYSERYHKKIDSVFVGKRRVNSQDAKKPVFIDVSTHALDRPQNL